jgi:dihydrofolate reductase
MVTLYNVTSADGFIADKVGKEDFIPDKFWDVFVELCKQYDVVVMGRKTYEAIQKYDHSLESFEKLPIKRVVVSRNSEFQPIQNYLKVNSLREAIKMGKNVLISSGPTLNNAAFAENFVDKVLLRVLPVSIGEGIPAFDKQFKDLSKIEILQK